MVYLDDRAIQGFDCLRWLIHHAEHELCIGDEEDNAGRSALWSLLNPSTSSDEALHSCARLVSGVRVASLIVFQAFPQVKVEICDRDVGIYIIVRKNTSTVFRIFLTILPHRGEALLFGTETFFSGHRVQICPMDVQCTTIRIDHILALVHRKAVIGHTECVNDGIEPPQGA